MSTKISCPNCHASYRLRDDLLGKKLKCAKCQKAFVAEAPIEVIPIDIPPLDAEVIDVEMVAPTSPPPVKRKNIFDELEENSQTAAPTKSPLFDDPLFANTPPIAPRPTSKNNAPQQPSGAKANPTNYWEQMGMAATAPAPVKTKPAKTDDGDMSVPPLAGHGIFLVMIACAMLILGAFGYELGLRRLKIVIPTALYLPLGWLGCVLIVIGYRTHKDFRVGLWISGVSAALLPVAGIVVMLLLGDSIAERERQATLERVRGYGSPSLPNPPSMPNHSMNSPGIRPASPGPAVHPRPTNPGPESGTLVNPPNRFSQPGPPSLKGDSPQTNREGPRNQPTMPGRSSSGLPTNPGKWIDDDEPMPGPPHRATELKAPADDAIVGNWRTQLIHLMTQRGINFFADAKDKSWSQQVGQPTFPRWKKFLNVDGMPATGMIANLSSFRLGFSEVLPIFPGHNLELTESAHSFAPEGYAIGGVDLVLQNDAITRIRPIYCRIDDNGKLDPNDCVSGEWLGEGPVEEYSTIPPTQRAVIGFAISIDAGSFCLIYR